MPSPSLTPDKEYIRQADANKRRRKRRTEGTRRRKPEPTQGIKKNRRGEPVKKRRSRGECPAKK
ncbi:hypothetical protein NC653_016911 [Populus alba x Populus x berolinensis]|uniref:Uncharacterized protein n=1 Tax=Populus alba x Populus x berolinensis TaxID=444605 RepID=A0AAD6QPD6_9ROSI|nr:hypothetical protein NC653_016911 [Populus alba x Populus x berolinensis]